METIGRCLSNQIYTHSGVLLNTLARFILFQMFTWLFIPLLILLFTPSTSMQEASGRGLSPT